MSRHGGYREGPAKLRTADALISERSRTRRVEVVGYGSKPTLPAGDDKGGAAEGGEIGGEERHIHRHVALQLQG